jgi:hypothetical protein
VTAKIMTITGGKQIVTGLKEIINRVKKKIITALKEIINRVKIRS